MDTQLKQRLTGAIILVLIGALLVPELLTGPRSRNARPADTPLDAGAMRSHEITIGDEPGSVAPPAVVPPPVAPPPVVMAPAVSAPPASPKPAAPASPVAVPSASGTPAPAPAVSRAPPPSPATSAKTAARTGYVVQVGSFSSRPAADRLAADLRRRGFDSAVSSVQASGRQLFRVRVGPARDRDAATALATRLKSAGYAGSVVPVG